MKIFICIIVLMSQNLSALSHFYIKIETNNSCKLSLQTYCEDINLGYISERVALLYLDRLCFELKNLKGKLKYNNCDCVSYSKGKHTSHENTTVPVVDFDLYKDYDEFDGCGYRQFTNKQRKGIFSYEFF